MLLGWIWTRASLSGMRIVRNRDKPQRGHGPRKRASRVAGPGTPRGSFIVVSRRPAAGAHYNPAVNPPVTDDNRAGTRPLGQAPLGQSADAVLMVRPAAFGWNPETEGSNAFQRRVAGPAGTLQERALAEFDALAAALRSAGVEVYALAEPGPGASPDAVFPNNWVSLHHDGTVVLYPMMAPSRRIERRMELIRRLEELGGHEGSRLVDLSHHELGGRFLEGTGSVVFDHAARVAYACRSPRTDESVLRELCEAIAYESVVFDAADATGVPVYHTNVLLSIGTRAVIVCADAVPGAGRGALLERLQAGGRRIVTIDHAQMADFAGNALELRARGGSSLLAMSARAWQAFGPAEREVLRDAVDAIVDAEVPTIEQCGGGSVRCMLAEVFLPRAGGSRARTSG